MHDIRYNEVDDEFFVANPFAQAILVFRGGANGQEAPIRIIQGPKTKLSGPDRLDIDVVHNEIFVPERDSVLVFPLKGDGDVAPIRIIQGPDTQLRRAQALAVDPINNLLVVADDRELLIFNRTDNGNAKPLRVIRGPRTSLIRITQITAYPPRRLVLVTMPGIQGEMEPPEVFVGVWSLDDNGDVPPRWKIGGPNTLLKKPRGVALNPKHKEVIVADMRLNAVLTYHFPEIF